MVASDYAAHYRYTAESPFKRGALMLPRVITNPSMHAAILIRLLICAPRGLTWIWRNLLIAKHSMDVDRDVQVGPGLVLPHPVGIVIGPGVVIGSNVGLFQHVTLGVHPARTGSDQAHGRRSAPVLGDRVVVYTHSVIAGAITIGAGAIVGANSYVDRDVPGNALVHGVRGGSRVRAGLGSTDVSRADPP
jgi:serine O-acetyltransferase